MPPRYTGDAPARSATLYRKRPYCGIRYTYSEMRRPRRAAAAVPRMAAYLRVSTEEQGDSGLGLDAQRRAIAAACAARGWQLAAEYHDVASGKTLNGRPGLHAALESVRSGAADGLVVAKLDRLARSVIDAATFVEEATRDGWLLALLDVGVDLSTAQGEAMANMTATFARLEARLIADRTRAALAVLKAQGVRLGRPRALPLSVVARVAADRAAGATLQGIADALTADGVATAHGGTCWRPSSVAGVLSSAALDAATPARALAGAPA
jgi:DNA invertase Pin-like site-specific DNA recombinase